MFFLSDLFSDYYEEYHEEEISKFVEKFNTYLEYIEQGRETFFIEDMEEEIMERLDEVLVYNFPQMEEVMDRIIERYPYFSEFLYYKGVYCLKLNRYEEAEYYLTKCIQLSPINIECLNNLADAKSKLGKYEEAEELLLNAIKIDPADFEAYSKISAIYINVYKKIELGFEYLKLGLESIDRSNKYELFFEIITYYMEFNMYDEALEIIEEYSDPDDEPELKQFKGIILFNKGKYEEAVEELKNLESFDAIVTLGLCYQKLGKHEEAIELFKEILDTEYFIITSDEIPFHIAENYKSLGKLDEALYYYNISIENDYEVERCYYNKGEIFLLNKNYYKAIIEFKKVISLDEDYINAYVKLADALLNIGRKKDAKEYYKIAIEKGENSYETWFKLGLIYSNSGDLNLALDSFNETIQRNPKYSCAYYEKAKVLINLKRQDDVVENLKIAIKYSPEIRNKLKLDFKDPKYSDIIKNFLD